MQVSLVYLGRMSPIISKTDPSISWLGQCKYSIQHDSPEELEEIREALAADGVYLSENPDIADLLTMRTRHYASVSGKPFSADIRGYSNERTGVDADGNPRVVNFVKWSGDKDRQDAFAKAEAAKAKAEEENAAAFAFMDQQDSLASRRSTLKDDAEFDAFQERLDKAQQRADARAARLLKLENIRAEQELTRAKIAAIAPVAVAASEPSLMGEEEPVGETDTAI